jgi:hypothetical protein
MHTFFQDLVSHQLWRASLQPILQGGTLFVSMNGPSQPSTSALPLLSILRHAPYLLGCRIA